MEKRISARVPAHQRVEYRHAQGQGEGMLMNLSLHGCRINGGSSLPCGARVRLQLWLPDQAEPVKIEQAFVRWVKNDQCGVSFLEVPSNVQARLQQVCRVLDNAQHPVEQIISLPGYDFGQSANMPDVEVRGGR